MKSTIKALIGLGVMLLGMLFLLSAIFGAIFSSFLIALGIIPSWLLAGSALIILVSAIMVVVGSRIFFENETKLVLTLFGLTGLLFIIIGFLLIETIFAALVAWAIGLAFIAYGFDVNALKPLKELVTAYTKLIGVK